MYSVSLTLSRRLLSIFVFLGLTAQFSSAGVRFFDDEPSFVAAIDPLFYMEDFDTFAPGFIAGPLDFGIVNDYGYRIFDRTPEGDPSVWGLFAGVGVMSTDTDSDSLVVDFFPDGVAAGDPVTAFGGNFFLTDFVFNVIPGGLILDVQLVSGASASITLTDPTENTFLGITTSEPISEIALTGAIMPTVDTWPTMDNFYVGEALGPACDLDNDGSCSLSDIDLLSADIAGNTHSPGLDLTGDGLVTMLDHNAWLAKAASENGFANPYILGDANLNGVVDGIDFTIWSQNKFTATTDWSKGNFNGNLVVDGVDFTIWSQNKFTSSNNPVPEPTVVSVLWLGAVILCFSDLKRR